jgi:hypothetical protein
MGIADKMRKDVAKEVSEKKELPKQVTEKIESTSVALSADELEFLIRLIGDSNFKGNNLMFIYDLVKKLQNEYVRLQGGK